MLNIKSKVVSRRPVSKEKNVEFQAEDRIKLV
jgi:hypothetical protein